MLFAMAPKATAAAAGLLELISEGLELISEAPTANSLRTTRRWLRAALSFVICLRRLRVPIVKSFEVVESTTSFFKLRASQVYGRITVVPIVIHCLACHGWCILPFWSLRSASSAPHECGDPACVCETK